MSYIALARRYRPKNFAELRGQEVLTTTLTNAIKLGRIHHAYLLTGIRGVGKTTTARIIAKNLNCEKGETAEPCEICGSCIAISNGSHPDVIEFDAASNTGIEDVKIILSNSHYAPVQGRKKVFIIDEVHMLSTKAFNSLLKTLEEPSPNIVFIFATTEVKKVPVTILSRCQKFFLKALDEGEILSGLTEIAAQEGYRLAEEAGKLLARKAEGSMRDGISLLDQAILNINFGGEASKEITPEVVKEMMKLPSRDEISALFSMIAEGSAQMALEKLNEIMKLGISEEQTLYDLLEQITSVIKHKSGLPQSDLTEDYHNLSLPFLLRFWQLALRSLEELKTANNRRAVLEIAIIRICYTCSLPTPIELIERLKNKSLNQVLSIFEDAKIVE